MLVNHLQFEHLMKSFISLPVITENFSTLSFGQNAQLDVLLHPKRFTITTVGTYHSRPFNPDERNINIHQRIYPIAEKYQKSTAFQFRNNRSGDIFQAEASETFNKNEEGYEKKRHSLLQLHQPQDWHDSPHVVLPTIRKEKIREELYKKSLSFDAKMQVLALSIHALIRKARSGNVNSEESNATSLYNLPSENQTLTRQLSPSPFRVLILHEHLQH